MKFEIIRTKIFRQKYRFRIVAQNGKILASSEKYYNLGDCEDAIKVIRDGAATATTYLQGDL